MKTLIIIPTYNEKENIIELAKAVFEKNPDASILVVDDDSPDGTAKAIKMAQNNLPNLHLFQRSGEKGFGRSYIDGFKKAHNKDYKFIVMMDADFSHDPAEVPKMTEKLSSFDLVIGSRYMPGGRIENWNWRRRLLSRFANFYARDVLQMKIHDLTTGFMCFRADILDNLNLESIRSEGYAFLIELKYAMAKAGYRIMEHPIVFNERREGQSKMSFKNIWEAVWMPFKLKFSNK